MSESLSLLFPVDILVEFVDALAQNYFICRQTLKTGNITLLFSPDPIK